MFGRTSFGRADRFFAFTPACTPTPQLSSPLIASYGQSETLGSCLHIRRAFLAELVVMNGASDVPPICAHRVRQASIIALFLAARTHSQFVPNIFLQAEHTPLHQSVLHLSDDGGGGIRSESRTTVRHYFCVWTSITKEVRNTLDYPTVTNPKVLRLAHIPTQNYKVKGPTFYPFSHPYF